MMSVISKAWPVFECRRRICLATNLLNQSRYTWRNYSKENKESGIAKANPTADISTDVRPIGEKIKETTKTISYTGVILVGVGVTGVIFYYVFRELFSSNSPNSIYSVALEKCKNDPRIEDALGIPIKGYGEETSRRRRSHVSHAIYERDGATCMRMKFYIKGTRNQATVELDMVQNEYGNYESRYLFAQLNDYSRKVIVIEDNRAQLDSKNMGSGLLPTLNLS